MGVLAMGCAPCNHEGGCVAPWQFRCAVLTALQPACIQLLWGLSVCSSSQLHCTLLRLELQRQPACY